MGNSQSDDVTVTASDNKAATDGSSGGHSVKVVARSVSYSSGVEGHEDKCCVNTEDSDGSPTDQADDISSTVDNSKVETEVTKTEQLPVMSGIGITNKDNMTDIRGVLEKDHQSSGSIAERVEGTVSSDDTPKRQDSHETAEQKTDQVKSDIKKEARGTTTSESHLCQGELQHNKPPSVDSDTLGFTDGTINSAPESSKSNNNPTTSVSTEGESFYKDIMEEWLKNDVNSKKPGSGSSFNADPIEGSNNISLSGDLNDKGSADCKQGSLHTDPSPSTENVGSIDLPCLSQNSNSEQCQPYKSPISLQGQIDERGQEWQDSLLLRRGKTVLTASESIAKSGSKDCDETMDDRNSARGNGVGDSLNISRVIMRSKKNSPRNRMGVLFETDITSTKATINEWISEQQLLITQRCAGEEEEEEVTAGSVFCSQVTHDCKVIFAPGIHAQGADNIESVDPVRMTERACQTEPVSRLSIAQDQTRSSIMSEELGDVLVQLNTLKEENRKLHQLLQCGTILEAGQQKEENNNTESVSVNREVVSSVSEQRKQDQNVEETSQTTEITTEISPVKTANEGESTEESTVKCPETEEPTEGYLAVTDDNGVDNSVDITTERENDEVSDVVSQKVCKDTVCDTVSDLQAIVTKVEDVELRRDVDGHKEPTNSVKKRESSFFDDLPVPSSPHETLGGGFSFDDILKANLEYLSDDDLFGHEDLIENTKNTKKAEGKLIEPNVSTDRSEPQSAEDFTEKQEEEAKVGEESENVQPQEEEISNDANEESETTEESESVSGTRRAMPESVSKVSNSAKFWETKLTTIHRDKTVAGSGENLDIDSNSIENIHKTKLLWEEKQSSSPPSEEAEVRPSEFSDDKLTASIRQTKIKWEERMSSEQNSGSNSSRRRSLEDLNHQSNGSDLEESLGTASKILQKKMLWEGMNISPNSSFRGDSPPKRLTLDYDSQMEKKDVSQTKMKWEGMLEKRESPEPARRAVRLVSKSDLELEAEILSSNVEVPSISGVSNTKSKFEKLFSSSDEVKCGSPERLRRSERRSQSPLQSSRNVMFSSLKEKFEGSKAEPKMKEGISLDNLRKLQPRNDEDITKANGQSHDQKEEDDPFLSMVTDESCVEDSTDHTDTLISEDRVSESDTEVDDMKGCIEESATNTSLDTSVFMDEGVCCPVTDTGPDGVVVSEETVERTVSEITEDTNVNGNQIGDLSKDENICDVTLTKDLDGETSGRDHTAECGIDTLTIDSAVDDGTYDSAGCASEVATVSNGDQVSETAENLGDTDYNQGVVQEEVAQSIQIGDTDSKEHQVQEDVLFFVQNDVTVDNNVSPSNGHGECTEKETLETNTQGVNQDMEEQPACISVKDSDTGEGATDKVRGSSESFCDSELEFVKGKKGQDTKVELTVRSGEVEEEDTSEC